MAGLLTAPSFSATEMLARLIAFDTTSRNSNLDLIDFVRNWLDTYHVPYRLSFDPTGKKANLHAIIGPVEAGGLAFSGHVDTVSADGQVWSGNPFELRRQNGRLIGRGTCDMKGFVAAALSLVPYAASCRLVKPMHLFLTYDEEVGYHGARRLIEDLNQSGLWPAACVVGEASGMLPILANKGRMIVRVGVRGHAAHSSLPHRGVNAVHAAAEAVQWVASQGRHFAQHGPAEAGFEPPYTTFQIANFTCDMLPNTVPARVSFDIEMRNIPGDDPAETMARFQKHVFTTIEPQMYTLQADTGFEYETILDLDALSLPADHELARIVMEITGASEAGKVSYCSEGSLFQRAGIPCLVCGPGNIGQVHQPDEWITEGQLAMCEDFIQRLVDRMLV